MNKKIFVGGVGRSGTTILTRFLGTHKEIYSIAFESRFITDKNGILDLFYSLSENYSTNVGRMAIQDFLTMMKDLSNPFSTPYLRPKDLKSYFGNDLSVKLDDLLGLISHGLFVGTDFSTKDKYAFMPLFRQKFSPISRGINKLYYVITRKRIQFLSSVLTQSYPPEKIYIGKYFEDKNELAAILNEFVSALFQKKTDEANKKHWCEKTPGNSLRMNDLLEIFPEAYYIHITRHPVGVAQSYKKQRWAPNNYGQICDLLENQFRKLIKIEENALKNDQIRF